MDFLVNQPRLTKFVLFVLVAGAIVVAGSLGMSAGSIQSIVTASGAFRSPEQVDVEELFPFPEDFMSHVTSAAGARSQAYEAFAPVVDDLEMITVDIPAEWQDIDMGSWTYHGNEVGVFIAASANLDHFYATRAEPGVFVGAIRASRDVIMRFEQDAFSRKCKRSGRYAYKDNFYAGVYDLYTDCLQQDGHSYLVAVALPADQEYLMLLRIAITSKADLQAATRIFESFQFLGQQDLHDSDLEHGPADTILRLGALNR